MLKVISILNVPVMTVPGRGGLNFDLNLTYTPGIKATDEASWVGLGWNLDIGQVTRIVTGGMDETINKTEYPIPPGAPNPSYFPDDETRDIYSISCPGGAGNALQFPDPSDPDNKYILQLEEWKPWKITYDESYHRFIVVIENGTIYVFNHAGPEASAMSSSNSSGCGTLP